MNHESESVPSLTRRSLLGQAVGAAALAATAQTQPGGENSAPRIRESFDFGWKFFKGDAPGAQQPDFTDAPWRGLDLPHDWSIEGPYSEKETAQGSLPAGIGWYRKRFRLPESSRGRKFFIEFEGVFENSEVWINGQYLGKRPFGYITFWYDMTPHLVFGARDNVIAVKVDNSNQPNSRWYTGSGIYRHTWLLTSNNVHVAHWGTFVTTPQVSDAAASVQVKTRVGNEGKAAAECTLATSILDRDGKVIQTDETSQEVGVNGEYEFMQVVKVEKPNLWSVETPYLYTVRSTVRDQSGIVDVYDTPIGIREAVFDADKGFVLNGQRVKINGVCVHHEAGPVGAAVPERVWGRRLEVLKAMGCNGIRTSHNPPAPGLLDLCDRMGFLVMDEAFDEWRVSKTRNNGYTRYFNDWYERDVTDFVHRDRNHPSVVLWSAGNEIGDQSAPNGAETLRQLLTVFHREDPTRLVTAACDRIESEPLSNRARPEFLALLDVVGYNYVDRWRDRIEKYYSLDKAAYPQRRMIGTESSGMGGPRGSYAGIFPQALPAAAAVPAPPAVAGAPGAAGGRGGGMGGMMMMMGRGGGRPNTGTEQLWKFVATYDYVAGDHMWTGIDYLGESRWPGKGATSGVIDTCGFPKDGYYFYQSQWTTAPMLHLSPHWNWKGHEGDFIPVTCYTNCESVELFVNGKSAGVQGYQFPRYGMTERYGNYGPLARGTRTTSDLHLTWTIPYQPGTLKAVGRREGKDVVAVEIGTTGEAAGIDLKVDRGAIAADRRDVAHITARIVDAQGRMVPDAAHEVAFEVQGEGKLIGVDNGDMQSHDDYKSNRRKAFSGMCLAIVQAGGKPGQIRVTASSPGLKPGSVTIATNG
ncbi:MAG: glycoside hydrolase family 2 TIM barrel-domain containing protein [Bryobacteraceae bacterium]|jgi:beta-galactosidase